MSAASPPKTVPASATPIAVPTGVQAVAQHLPHFPSAPPSLIVCANFVCGGKRAVGFRALRAAGRRGASHTWLCASCFIYFRKERFCPHCGQIYRQADRQGFDGQLWAECARCVRWAHVACEAKAGHVRMVGVIRDPPTVHKDRVISYVCHDCGRTRGKSPSLASALPSQKRKRPRGGDKSARSSTRGDMKTKLQPLTLPPKRPF